jgi:hypothetical protein
MHRTFGRGRKSEGVFMYAIDVVAIDRAVDRKAGILARWKDGRCAAAAGSADSGIADAAGMVPGSLCRCRRSAPDLHGASRTGREECQFPEHSEGRERSGCHALGASCGTRKRRFREDRGPQGNRCSRRQEPGARRSRDAGTERACAQGVARGDRSFVETRSSRANASSENQRQRIPVTKTTNQTSFPAHAARSLAAACAIGNRLTVRKGRCSSIRSRNTSTSFDRIHNRAFSGQPNV